MTSLTDSTTDAFAEARTGAARPPVAEAGDDLSADLRITAKTFVLRAACEKASRVVPTKDTMDVLKNLLIVADISEEGAHRLRIQATDLELSVISSTTLVNVERPGTAVFPAKLFLDTVKAAKDEDIVIDVQGGNATITTGTGDSGSATMRLQSAEDYPELPDVANMTLHAFDRVAFLGAIQSVKDAAAQLGDTRGNLMMIDITNGQMTAADGVRFQRAAIEGFPLDMQIPIGAVDDIVGLLRTTDLQDVHVGEAENHLAFKIGTDVFITNKLMDDFPDVEAILLRPALSNDQELTVDREELVDAVKRVRIHADPDSSALVLRLTKDLITVEAKNKKGGGAVENVAAGWSRANRVLCVNHKFFTAMLGMYDGRSCKFLLGADTKSRKSMVLLRDEGQGTTGIIQQMRADWVTDEGGTK